MRTLHIVAARSRKPTVESVLRRVERECRRYIRVKGLGYDILALCRKIRKEGRGKK